VRGLTAGRRRRRGRPRPRRAGGEKALGLDVEAGVQALLVDVEPLTTLANWVYIWGPLAGHRGVLLWLAVRNRTVFLRLRNAMVASG
jgi:hypothetical protein